MTFLRNLLAALALAAFGAYVLRGYHTTAGLVMGGLAILGALSIAFPTQIDGAGAHVKGVLVLILPTVVDAMRGGDRKSDPPADPPGPVT